MRASRNSRCCPSGRRGCCPGGVKELELAYVFLRNLEHRLQYLDDQQTHALPAAPADRLTLARSMGCADAAGLLAELERHRAAVVRHFEAIFAETAQDHHALTALWHESAEDGRALAHSRSRFGMARQSRGGSRLS